MDVALPSMDLPVAITTLGDQFGAAFIITSFIEWLKRSRFPWLDYSTERLNRLAMWILAGGAAVGINASYDYDSATLTITGLSLTSIALVGWEWLKSGAITDAMYHWRFYRKPSAEQVAVAIKADAGV